VGQARPSLHERGRTGVAVLVAALLLAGCGGGDPEATDRDRPTASRSAETTSAPPAVVAPPAPTPTVEPGGTDAAGLVVPAETAGDLDSRSVPQAPDLGAGWTRYVDPGDVAEGYTGNGSWVRARGAAEVVQSVVPLGCTGLTSVPRLPVPRHALEATYRGPRDAPGVALVLEYRDRGEAAAFVAGMARIARSCPEPEGGVRPDDPFTVVIEPLRVSDRVVLDRRREHGAGAGEWLWSEAVVREGDRVGLLILASPPSGPRPDLTLLSQRLRAAVPR